MKDTKIYHQIHKRCGGTVGVAVNNGEVVFVCDRCAGIFQYNISLPIHKEWRNVKKSDGTKIIKPNK